MNPANTGNVIEDNVAVGNVIGIILVAGIQGETIRRNYLMGNPPLQVSLDHTSDPAADIVNLAATGANTFQANVCLTAVNAPCPAAVPPSLTASPNPIPVTGNAQLGVTTISWMAPSAEAVEVRVGSTDGPLLVSGSDRGSAQTGLWVADGTTFYLQDVSGGKPLNADNTLATRRGSIAEEIGPHEARFVILVLCMAGKDGKLGFTKSVRKRARGFQG